MRKPVSVLITDGVFRLSRNPGYLALTLLYVGLASTGRLAPDHKTIAAMQERNAKSPRSGG